MSPTVTRAVIPSAGWGTRLLPATKVVPKVLTTVVDRPVIQWAVEESSAAGVDEVCLVVSPAMPTVAEHFRPAPVLEDLLRAKGSQRELTALEDLVGGPRVETVVQDEARGLGHAILQAAEFVGRDPFAVLLPDVVIGPETGLMARLIEVHQEKGGCVLALFPVPSDKVSSYGIADVRGGGDEPGPVEIVDLVEKPSTEDAPSNLSVAGRYVLTASVIDALRTTPPSAGGEIQLTDAIQAALGAGEPVHGVVFTDALFDTGSIEGLIEANVALGLAHERYGPALRQILARHTVGQ